MKVCICNTFFKKNHFTGFRDFSALRINKIPELTKFIVLFILIIIGNSIVFGQNQDINNEVRRLLTRARAAYEIEEYQDALKEYQAVSKLVPDFADIYKAIGDAYEKIGGEDNLLKAIENYNQYLSLNPNAEDKASIQEKVFQLEYLFEKVAEKSFILDDFNGIWVSDLVSNKVSKNNMLMETLYRVDQNLTPILIFRISEMGRTGRYRVEILKESDFYQESIIHKIVSIYPDKNNSIRFTFADEARYIPSQSKWEALRWLGGFAGQAIGGIGGGIVNVGVSTFANIGQENDIPSNTQTVYDFELQYKDGALVGYCNVIQGYSSARASQDTKNDFYEIKFWKENDYIEKLNMLKDEEERRRIERKANKPVSFGFYAGVNYSNFNIKNNHQSIATSPSFGLQVGVFLEIKLLDFVYLQPGVNYYRRSISIDNYDDFQALSYKFNQNCYQIPINLLLKYKFGKSSLFAGFGFYFEGGGERTYLRAFDYEQPGYVLLKQTDVGMNMKLGLSTSAFFVEFGYNAGMNDVSLDRDYSIKKHAGYGSLGLRF